ncbi:VanZ family protein [Paenibacillus thalictri]|uniref:VanZ family protein n=1 Tax=Paenibacillus thalictri TaxID=2527873 RepID=A0A4Q9DXU1_9BACL|nr:VanZ family protein [Paenibacillus thalictri]
MNLKLIYRWIPAIISMDIIFYLSSQTYHQQDIRPKLQEFLPDKQQIINTFSGVSFNYGSSHIGINNLGVYGFIEFFIRKTAHFSIYFILAICVAFALQSKSKLRISLYTVVFCFLYACSDEFHQSITGDRTPLFSDVIVDTIGSVFGLILFLIIFVTLQRRKRAHRSLKSTLG